MPEISLFAICLSNRTGKLTFQAEHKKLFFTNIEPAELASCLKEGGQYRVVYDTNDITRETLDASAAILKNGKIFRLSA